ncbi:MAG: lipopolysaccharide kinase InaA family protein [Candidatus Binatales bacterium]
MRRQLIYARSPDWAEIAARAEDLISSAAFEPVKDETKTRAGFIALENGASAFIKRFDRGSLTYGWWLRIRGSRARRSIRGAALLRAHGFGHPEPYAALELSSAGSIRVCYLISEPLRNAKTLSVSIDLRGRARGAQAAWRRSVLAAVAREIRRLHEAGLFSSDLQETNLMIERSGGEPRIYFVDLDGFRHLGRVRQHRRERNLVQLDRSIGRFLRRGARLRFLYDYLGARPQRREARAIVARLLERKRREDRKRQARRAGESACRSAPASGPA